MNMGFIRLGSHFINLDNVIDIHSKFNEVTVFYNARGSDTFGGEEMDALAAWLNVPNHMAGIIDPVDRDVMAWWERQQKDKETIEFNKSVIRSMFLSNPDATETEA